MMNELLKTVVVKSYAATMAITGAMGALGPVVFTSTGDKFIFTAVAPVRLLKWGVLFDQAALVTGGSNLVLTLASLPTAGSAANRATIDTITITDPNSAYVLGTGFFRRPYTASTTATTPVSQVAAAGPLGNTANTTEEGQAQGYLNVGQAWVVAVTTAATTTGTGSVFIEYELLPITLPSGYGTTSAGTDSMTENYTAL
jgi:hypothetical protein